MTLLFMLIMNFAGAEKIDRILAIVNNEIITQSDMSKFQKTMKSNGMFDERLMLDYTREQALKDKEIALEILINKRIVEVEIKRHSLQAPVEKVEQEFRRIAGRNNLSKDQLFEALKAQGIDIDEYRTFLRESLERQSLLEKEVMSKIKVSEEEIATYFSRNNKLGKDKIFEYTIAHIYFDPDKGGKEAAGERAKEVFSRLKKGEPFDSLANQTTEESQAEAGGLLGTFKSGEFSKDFENAVRGLDVGEYSEIIPSKSGLHIIKLVNRKLITDPAYEKERAQVQAILQKREFLKIFKDWLESRRQDLFVRLNQ